MGCVDALLPPFLEEIEGAEGLADEPRDRLIGFISQRATDGGASTATTQEPDSGGSPLGDFDEDYMPMVTVAGIVGWDWWDSISWDQLLKMPSITSPLIPRGVRQAVATFKGKICSAIEEGLVKNDVAGQTRAR